MAEIELREVDGQRTAFVAEWNVPVWVIIAAMERTRGDLHQTARRLNLSVDVVRAALWYAASHSREIHDAMREQPGAKYQGVPRRRPNLTTADMLSPFEELGIPLRPFHSRPAQRK